MFDMNRSKSIHVSNVIFKTETNTIPIECMFLSMFDLPTRYCFQTGIGDVSVVEQVYPTVQYSERCIE